MSIPLPRPPSPVPSDLSDVTLREGPPTRGELAKFYPARYTWRQLKDFIISGDLGLLKRHPVLQVRYSHWAAGIAREHGSITNYLVNVRLGWGPPPQASTPPTTTTSPCSSVPSLALDSNAHGRLAPEFEKNKYFTSKPSRDDVKIIFNDWPYSIPPEISHYLIWSRLPVVHPALVHPSVADQVDRDGLWGFTGVDTLEKQQEEVLDKEDVYNDVAPGTSPAARAHILAAASHTRQFVLAHWPEDQWEVAWFVNPTRIQSVKDLAHIHVFARRKPDASKIGI